MAVAQFLILLLHTLVALANLLLVQLVVEFKVFNLLAQAVILAVVAHGIHLTLEALNVHVVHLDGASALVHLALHGHNVRVDFLNADGETLNLVFKVLHLQGKFAAQGLDVVNLCQLYLQ